MIVIRPDPVDPVHDDLVFITSRGQPWVKYVDGDGTNRFRLPGIQEVERTLRCEITGRALLAPKDLPDYRQCYD